MAKNKKIFRKRSSSDKKKQPDNTEVVTTTDNNEGLSSPSSPQSQSSSSGQDTIQQISSSPQSSPTPTTSEQLAGGPTAAAATEIQQQPQVEEVNNNNNDDDIDDDIRATMGRLQLVELSDFLNDRGFAYKRMKFGAPGLLVGSSAAALLPGAEKKNETDDDEDDDDDLVTVVDGGEEEEETESELSVKEEDGGGRKVYPTAKEQQKKKKKQQPYFNTPLFAEIMALYQPRSVPIVKDKKIMKKKKKRVVEVDDDDDNDDGQSYYFGVMNKKKKEKGIPTALTMSDVSSVMAKLTFEDDDSLCVSSSVGGKFSSFLSSSVGYHQKKDSASTQEEEVVIDVCGMDVDDNTILDEDDDEKEKMSKKKNKKKARWVAEWVPGNNSSSIEVEEVDVDDDRRVVMGSTQSDRKGTGSVWMDVFMNGIRGGSSGYGQQPQQMMSGSGDHDDDSQTNFKHPFDLKTCMAPLCKKKSTLRCEVCDILMFCSGKHQRSMGPEHQKLCNGYNLADCKSGYGKIAIAARSYKNQGEFILSDEPLFVLPFNPSSSVLLSSSSESSSGYDHDGSSSGPKLSRDYCVQCFVDHSLPVHHDSILAERGFRSGTRECPTGCGFRICEDSRVCGVVLGAYKYPEIVPGHFGNECMLLRKAVAGGGGLKKHLLQDEGLTTIDDTCIALIRLLRLNKYLVERKGKPDPSVNASIAGMFTNVGLVDRSDEFKDKLRLVREVFGVDEGVVGEEELHQLDLVMKKFGRGFGVDVVEPVDPTFHGEEKEKEDEGSRICKLMCVQKYAKCIYFNVGYIQHSCNPNAILAMFPNYVVFVKSVKAIPKGKPITACYDNRCLFWPTFKRRRYIYETFGFVCRCERCCSVSELDSYFGGFPCTGGGCANNNDGETTRRRQSCIVPAFPLDEYSYWECGVCRSERISHARAVLCLVKLEDELEEVYSAGEPLALVRLLCELVDGGFLHWGHYLAFEYSVKVLRLLWGRICAKDLGVVRAVGEGGEGLLAVACCVFAVTGKFHPCGYLHSFVLPLRLAAVIRLRHMAIQFEQRKLSASKLNEHVNDMYFRGSTTSPRTRIGPPLYNRRFGIITEEQQDNMDIVEMNASGEIIAAVQAQHGKGSQFEEVPKLMEMFGEKLQKCPQVPFMQSLTKLSGMGGKPLQFPWSWGFKTTSSEVGGSE